MKRFKPCKTSGSHRWKGAIPSFIANAIVIIIEDIRVCTFKIDHSPLAHALIMAANKIKADAEA